MRPSGCSSMVKIMRFSFCTSIPQKCSEDPVHHLFLTDLFIATDGTVIICVFEGKGFFGFTVGTEYY